MRKASSNWLGKIVMATVMGVLIVSFAEWGIADIFKGFGGSGWVGMRAYPTAFAILRARRLTSEARSLNVAGEEKTPDCLWRP